MSSELAQFIIAMNDEKAIVAARALITFLDAELQDDPDARRPADVDVTDLSRFVSISRNAVLGLAAALEHPDVGNRTIAALARGLLLLTLEMGYAVPVDQASEPVLLAALSKGRYSEPEVVSALAAVLAWVPLDRRRRIRQLAVVTGEGIRIGTDREAIALHNISAQALEAVEIWWQSLHTDDFA